MYVCVQNEIQRTWAYLETLFIGSEEVKKELPVDADRFVAIDIDVKRVLKDILTVKNAVLACSKDPELIKTLESTKSKLEMCEKSLNKKLELKRRILAHLPPVLLLRQGLDKFSDSSSVRNFRWCFPFTEVLSVCTDVEVDV